jgi:hypothetical protein
MSMQTPSSPQPPQTAEEAGPGLPWAADAAFNRGVRAGLAFALGLLRHPKWTPAQAIDAVNAAVELASVSLTAPADPALLQGRELSRRNFTADMDWFFTEFHKQKWIAAEDVERELEALWGGEPPESNGETLK